MVVVAEPVFGSHRVSFLPCRTREELVDVVETRGAVVQAGQKRATVTGAARQPVVGRDSRRVRFQLIR
jgi:hypothetical protein